MINYNLNLTRDKQYYSNVSTDLLNQDKDAQKYRFYRNIRARFLQESANYLGADLSDRKVLSLCFGDYAQNAAQFNE